jgi:hypothetical protein
VPTLIELCADEGFEYAAFGRNLLDSSRPQVGFGRNIVTTPEFFLPLGQAEQPLAVPGQSLPNPMPSLEALRQEYLSLHALSWWRIMKGNQLPGK